MNVPYLRQLAFERFINLLLNKSAGDTRTTEQLRQIAAREVVQEARREARIDSKLHVGAHSQNTTANAFETLFKSAWKIVKNQKVYAELMQRRSFAHNGKNSKITPTIIDAPIVCEEQLPDVRKLPNDNVVTFPVFGSPSRQQLIPDGEGSIYPARYHSQVTQAWRDSISQNESIKRERELRSIQYRNSHKYVG
jgi:hypothetical protein